MMNQTVVMHQVHEIVLVQQMQFQSLHLPNIKPVCHHCINFHRGCLELYLPLRGEEIIKTCSTYHLEVSKIIFYCLELHIIVIYE